MLYWSVLLFFAAIAAGVFALLGSETAKVFLILFTALCAWTVWRSRHAREPQNLGPDS